MIPDLTPRDILKYKKDALRSGINGFEEIKALQLDQLEDAVTKELHTYQDRFDALMRSDPDYKYPPKYADNHFGYWEDHSCNYQECVKILNLIWEHRQGNIDSVPPKAGNAKGSAPNKLTDIWKNTPPHLLDELLRLSQEIDNLEKDKDSNRYVWNNESWKDLVVITERWKKEGFLAPAYSKYEAQTDLCRTVCNEFGLPSSGKKFNSICKAFNKSTILLNKDNLELEPNIKDSLQSLNARINTQL